MFIRPSMAFLETPAIFLISVRTLLKDYSGENKDLSQDLHHKLRHLESFQISGDLLGT